VGRDPTGIRALFDSAIRRTRSTCRKFRGAAADVDRHVEEHAWIPSDSPHGFLRPQRFRRSGSTRPRISKRAPSTSAASVNDPEIGIDWPLSGMPAASPQDRRRTKLRTPLSFSLRFPAHRKERAGRLGTSFGALAPARRGHAPRPRGLDSRWPDRIVDAVRSAKPGVVVNAAAYTTVDQAEREPAARMRSTPPRSRPPRRGSQARRRAARSLFDRLCLRRNQGSRPTSRKIRANPLGEYGRSKARRRAGDREIGGAYLILRTSWVYSTPARISSLR